MWLCIDCKKVYSMGGTVNCYWQFVKAWYTTCFLYWKPDGTWVYDNNEDWEDLQLEIPLPDGLSTSIEHCTQDTGVDDLPIWRSLSLNCCDEG